MTFTSPSHYTQRVTGIHWHYSGEHQVSCTPACTLNLCTGPSRGQGWRNASTGHAPKFSWIGGFKPDSPGHGSGGRRSLTQPGPLRATPSVQVATTGSDVEGCGSTAVPCATLSFAILAANAMQPLDDVVDVIVSGGKYDSRSCGAKATRPVNVTGAGSSDTVIDCAGLLQMLATNSSIAVAGVTILRGLLTAEAVEPASGGALIVGGGAAVSAVWSPLLNGAVALFFDVVATSNVVNISLAQTANTYVYAGGGAVLVVGGGEDTYVFLGSCSFENNTALVDASLVGPSSALLVCGGAVCVVPGLAIFQSQPVLGATVEVDSVSTSGNTVSCVGPCVNGKGDSFAVQTCVLASLHRHGSLMCRDMINTCSW
jgi:hypothetical protein